MCGRARCTLSAAQAARAFGFPTTTSAAAGGGGGGDGGGDAPAVRTLQMDRFRPSYNVTPGAYLPVGTLRARAAGDEGGAEEQGPVIQCMKWGLVPSFSSKTDKPDHFRMFNARSESIKEKASFRRLIPKNRCLVAVEGFYEWKKDGSKKQPYYIHFRDERPLVFAALFDTWTNSEGETLHTFTILTTHVSTSLKWLHDRMPVILGDEDSINAWLNNSSVKLEEITVPYEGNDLVWHPVTTAMGKTSFQGPDCIKEVKIGPSEKPISNFFTKKAAASVKPEKASGEFTGTESFKTAKEECDDDSGETPLNKTEQPHQASSEKQRASSAVVKNEPTTLDPQDFYKADEGIKKEDGMLPDDPFGIKRKIEDAGVEAEMEMEMEMEKSGRSPVTPARKKEKGPKDGQASLFSYFAKK